MNLNSKQATTGLTILIVIAIVFVLNFLVGGVGVGNFRIDLTQDKLYTLSQGTKNIIGRVKPEEPVTIRYYVTSEDRVMPPVLKTYARTVQDLLLEFEKQSDGKIVLEKISPNPNTEEEDKAREDEVQGMTANQEGDNVYLGMAIQCAGKKEVLPFLNPNEETSLEYNVARSIGKVISDKKTVIGVMSAMPIHGTPQMPWMQRQPGAQDPWVVIQRLRMDYEVREVPFTTDKIDTDITVLIVIHPASIIEQAEYAIDQYVMKGGKLIAFVDPQSWLAQVYSNQQPQNPMMGGQPPPTMIAPVSNLNKLFASWGVGFSDQIVADQTYLGQIQGRRNPTALSLPEAAINKDSRIMGGLKSLVMMGAGSISADKVADGIKAEVLIESSENSELIDSAAAEKLRTQPLTSFNPSGKKKTLAVQLTGKFKTSFPNGKPAPIGGEGAGGPPREGGGAQVDETAPKAATPPAAAPVAPPTTPPPSAPPPAAPPAAGPTPAPAPPPPAAGPAPTPPSPAPAAPATPVTVTTPPVSVPASPTPPLPPGLTPSSPAVPAAPATAVPVADAAKTEAKKDDGTIKESSGEPVVMIFSDADMMFDAFCVQQDRMTGGMIAINSNLPMFLNAVEVLAGGGDLLAVRSRASTQRPFTKLDEMRDSVEAKYRPQLLDLESQQQKIVQDIATKRGAQGQGGILLIDPNKDVEVKQLMENQVTINRKIREVKKEVNRDVDKTLNWLTILNLFAVPLGVIAIGGILAIRRRFSTAAR